jgi:general L-amino acid transport system substrate-binding protein
MVRRGDDEWHAMVKWVVYGLLEAEEVGITQANLEAQKSSTNPVVQRLLGTAEDTGKLLGLERDWMAKALKTTGNYGEIFERNVGPNSPIKLPRGLNHQWNKGGLMYAYPVR